VSIIAMVMVFHPHNFEPSNFIEIGALIVAAVLID